MLTIAGGIILAVLVLALLPHILEILVKAFFVTLLLIIGAIVVLFFSEAPELAFWLVPLLPAWVLFSLVSSISKHGGIQSWLEYLRIQLRRTRTANDIAQKAADLEAHTTRIQRAKEREEEERNRRKEEIAAWSISKLVAQVEKKIARFAPGAPVRAEKGFYSYCVYVGDVEIGNVDVVRADWFHTTSGGSHLSGDAGSVAAHLRDNLRRKLKASPGLIENLKMDLSQTA